jgi:hypothetical protein
MPITTPPVVSIVFPRGGEQIFGTPVVLDAGAQRGVAVIELWLNNTRWVSWPGAPFGTTGQPTTRYMIPLPDQVPDGIIDIIVDVKDDLGMSTRMPAITVVKGEPCTSADTCAYGQRCDAGRCLWDPPVGEFGDACEYPQYCKSGMCAVGGDVALCTHPCALDIAGSCPDGWSCLVNHPRNLCWPSEPAAGGCCNTGSPAEPAIMMGVLVLLVLTRRKRATGAARA